MDMNNIEGIVDDMMGINGAMAAAVIDWKSGMTLGMRSRGDFNVEIAAAGNAEVIKAKMATMKSLGISSTIDDILITLTDQLHIITLSDEQPELCLYSVIDAEKGNLALARNRLHALAK